MSDRPDQPSADSLFDSPAAPPAPRPLLEPVDGVPVPLSTAAEITELAAVLRAGTGPVALDAERASGYRYSARAQLIQLKRAGVGNVLIDPIAVPDLSAIGAALHDVEWVLHAANQDLPCLAEVGMVPSKLFDTELGGRLAGLDRVALGTMTQALLGISLAKGHAAADWSVRPLPQAYLVYAALDVEVLLELRDEVEKLLDTQAKLDWAHAEFEAVRNAPPPAIRPHRWRRLNGLGAVKDRRGLAVAEQLWIARDEIGERLDIAPGRLLADRSIVGAATGKPDSMAKLLTIDGFTRRGTIAHRRRWWEAVQGALSLPERALPARRETIDDTGAPPSRWMSKEPAVAARFSALRSVVLAASEEHQIPAENLISPGLIRGLAWDPPVATDDAVDVVLIAGGARKWQRELLIEPLAAALQAVADRPPGAIETCQEPA
ncbi:MAG: HRDC domain-containing protein [Antricoccus sp.]